MMPSRECATCANYRCYGVGDYGSPPYEVYCTEDDSMEDNPDFPFTPAPACYTPDFWQTEFAKDVDGSESSLDEAYQRFRAYVDQGVPL